ncbi:hypothetical protein VUR80DRAFT_2530 [Thermomyces stellatus]
MCSLPASHKASQSLPLAQLERGERGARHIIKGRASGSLGLTGAEVEDVLRSRQMTSSQPLVPLGRELASRQRLDFRYRGCGRTSQRTILSRGGLDIMYKVRNPDFSTSYLAPENTRDMGKLVDWAGAALSG